MTGVLNDPAGQRVLDGNSAVSGRPDLVGNPNASSSASGPIHNNNGIKPWYNTSAYAQVCPTVGGVTTCPTGARPGNSHPGSVRGPGIWRGDLSSFKNIKFTERINTQFRAEAFNVFNHTNPDLIGTSTTSGTFGKVTSYRDPRHPATGAETLFLELFTGERIHALESVRSTGSRAAFPFAHK